MRTGERQWTKGRVLWHPPLRRVRSAAAVLFNAVLFNNAVIN